MTETMPELRDKIASMIRDSLFGGGPPASEFLEEADELIATVRADLARPAPAEGAVREALRPFVEALEKTNEGFGIDVAEHCETANMVCQPYIRMEHFKAARKAFHASPEDATPAAPASVGEAARIVLAHMEQRDKDPQDSFSIRDETWVQLSTLIKKDTVR